jgi:UDP-GlcNAc:undecaprenyl-phosphate GlcNAc-1-phosphate transferase
MREYAVVLLTAGLVTFLTTPVVRMAAVRLRMMAAPRERDVHVIPTPRGGGVAMYLGVAAATLVASRLPALQRTFDDSQAYAVLVAGGLICLLGVLDDRFSLDALTKLTGQIAAAGVMVLLGVQLAFLFLPVADIGTLSLGSDLGVPATILLTVLTVNALNFIDGLDGLAAGVVCIAASAFFVYSYGISRTFDPPNVFSSATFISAALIGCCLGFLPHNYHPARLFMGDSGALLLGLLLAAAMISTTGNVTPSQVSTNPLAATLLPLVVPAAIILLPLVDILLAVVRRTRRGERPWQPDKQHLHHRMLQIGHGHRRAVLLLWLWAAVAAVGSVSFIFFAPEVAGGGVLALVLVAAVLTIWLPRWSHRRSLRLG